MCQGSSRLRELPLGDSYKKCFRLLSWYNRLLWVSITPSTHQHHQLHSVSLVLYVVLICKALVQDQSLVYSSLTQLCTHSLNHSSVRVFTYTPPVIARKANYMQS